MCNFDASKTGVVILTLGLSVWKQFIVLVTSQPHSEALKALRKLLFMLTSGMKIGVETQVFTDIYGCRSCRFCPVTLAGMA
jgi:hypothetical protein